MRAAHVPHRTTQIIQSLPIPFKLTPFYCAPELIMYMAPIRDIGMVPHPSYCSCIRVS